MYGYIAVMHYHDLCRHSSSGHYIIIWSIGLGPYSRACRPFRQPGAEKSVCRPSKEGRTRLPHCVNASVAIRTSRLKGLENGYKCQPRA